MPWSRIVPIWGSGGAHHASILLIDLGEYPGIIAGQQSVLGEIYVADEVTMAKLDALEEVPHEYSREMMQTPWGEAFYYHYRMECHGLAAIASGDWRCRFVC